MTARTEGPVTDDVHARRRRSRGPLDRVLAPALVVLLAGGVAAAVRADRPTRTPLVATSGDGEPPVGWIREAGAPELDGLVAADLVDRVSDEHTTAGSASARIEPLRYTSRPDGHITIHDGWVERNIDRVQLPGMAPASCHRVMIPQLLAAVDELRERGLYDHLDPLQFAGCFVARHIDRDPDRSLSMHAWGLAIDFNARDNPLGEPPVMDPGVVEVLARWGFDWGGHWRRPDGMHFELARIVPTA